MQQEVHMRSQLLTNSEEISDCGALTSRKRKSMNQSKYKTRMCRNYTRGVQCPFGERCAFSHGEPEASAAPGEEADSPSKQQQQPPPYSDLVPRDNVLPPAYPQRFRHDPYSGGFVHVS